jgi:TFIIF-interacting CTD phosphatase-like protein
VLYADRAPQPADTELAGQLFGEDKTSALNIATLAVPIPGGAEVTIHVKFRPHVHEFLHEAHKLFELHIYTMGDRFYADMINKCVTHGARCIVRRGD